jgi:hypothetical protein
MESVTHFYISKICTVSVSHNLARCTVGKLYENDVQSYSLLSTLNSATVRPFEITNVSLVAFNSFTGTFRLFDTVATDFTTSKPLPQEN